VEFLNEALLKA